MCVSAKTGDYPIDVKKVRCLEHNNMSNVSHLDAVISSSSEAVQIHPAATKTKDENSANIYMSDFF